MIKKYLGYVQNKKFGPYYIPARYQNILLKNYAFLKKIISFTSRRTLFFKIKHKTKNND